MNRPQVFNSIGDKEAFQSWKASHPTGVFLNWRKGTKGRRATKQDKIHQLGNDRCSSLRIEICFPGETWWKICAENVESVIAWAEDKGTHFDHLDQHLCRPCFGGGAKPGRKWDLRSVGSLPKAGELNRFVRDGEKAVITVETRRRCMALVDYLKAHLKSGSSDGKLHCAVESCNWANPSVDHFRGDLVEIHHRSPLAEAPAEGVEMDLASALENLVPLCPTCHRLVHAKSGGGVYTIEELAKYRK